MLEQGPVFTPSLITRIRYGIRSVSVPLCSAYWPHSFTSLSVGVKTGRTLGHISLVTMRHVCYTYMVNTELTLFWALLKEPLSLESSIA